MKKYIVLVPDKTKFTFKFINSDLCDFYNIYFAQKMNIILKIFRKFVYFIGLGFFNIFYDEWVKYLDQDVQFIVFDACRPYHRLQRKLRKAKHRPIIYYWNPIVNHDKISQLRKYFDVFTYSKIDAEKYGLHHNPTFFAELPLELNQPLKYDGCFVGVNKKRLSLLEKVYQLFNNPSFYVVKDKDEESSVLQLHCTGIAYSEYLKVLAQSESIVEVLYSDNADYSLRTMEALFYQKKLITNNRGIRDAVFFNPNNIYVLDFETSKEDIQEFLARPFIPYSNDQINYYRVDKWLDRFMVEK